MNTKEWIAIVVAGVASGLAFGKAAVSIRDARRTKEIRERYPHLFDPVLKEEHEARHRELDRMAKEAPTPIVRGLKRGGYLRRRNLNR